MKETLTSRLIDRPIRPLFPWVLRRGANTAQTLSSDGQNDPDILAMIGASARCAFRLFLSGAPGSVRLSGQRRICAIPNAGST